MCGIFGSVGKSRIDISENILPHRGPDDWGIVHHKCGHNWFTLFQSRLSIIGLGPQGHQPYQKYENYTLAYNGEIYNYLDVKKLILQKYNINLKTDTDTEVLYECLINLGIKETLEVIDGIFAFSFYDRKNEVLFLVRDHLGVKPLYYHFSAGQILFGSEPKVFFELGLIIPRLNRKLLGEYFANGWVYEPDTMFVDIKKIQAGHYLKISSTDMSIQNIEYWDIDYPANSTIQNIETVIESQIISDVPLGVYFSGGIDSSIIAHTLINKNYRYLNLDLNNSESRRVKIFEKLFGIKVDKIKYKHENLDVYNNLIYYLDEPIADPAILPAYLLAKESKRMGCIVMLSGMGGDEIDAGYTRHKIIFNQQKYKIFGYIPELKFIKGKKYRDLMRLKNFIKNPVPENYFSMTSYFSKHEIDQLVGNDWLSDYCHKIDTMVSRVDGLKKFLYLDFKGFLTSHNLLYMDKASMAASVEVRVPLLQKDIVSSFFQDIVTINRFGQKTRLKAILKYQLKENYHEVKKQGLRYPIDDWINSTINWKTIIDFFNDNGLLQTSIIRRWVNRLEYDINSVSMKLWHVYTLYRWLKTFSVR